MKEPRAKGLEAYSPASRVEAEVSPDEPHAGPGYCQAVEGVQSGDARVLTVVSGPRRRPQKVQVEFE